MKRRSLVGLSTLTLALSCGVLLLLAWVSPAPAADFVRGDCNDDGAIDISDPIFLLDVLFAAGPAPDCNDACDVNDDEALDIADVIYGLDALFAGGPAPSAPYPLCGADPAGTLLDCATYVACVTPISHATDIQPIWDDNCAPCHAGSFPAAGLGLVGDAYANIVNVPAIELASMNLITPGDPQESYLWHKIMGTQDSVGGFGNDMPPNHALTQGELDLISEWIQQGANP